MFNRFVMFFLLAEEVPDIEVGVGIIRNRSQSQMVTMRSLFQSIDLHENGAKVAQRRSVVRRFGENGTVKSFSEDNFTGLMTSHRIGENLIHIGHSLSLANVIE